MSKLHTDTPLAEAIFELFEEFATLTKEKFGQLPDGTIKAYIFGGCAVHLHTNARGSDDLDTELTAAEKLDFQSITLELDSVYFDDPERGESILDWDANFNTGIPPLAPDYKERAIQLKFESSPLHIYLISAADVAVSKLGRAAEDDINDIKTLFRAGCFTLDEFRALANEALKYEVCSDRLQSNIEFAISTLEELTEEFE